MSIPRDKTVHTLFEEQVERTPEATALVFGGDTLTYRELNARSNQLARHLRSAGVGPDVLVAVALERSAEMVVAVLAVLKAGGAYIPLDPSYPKEHLDRMLAQAKPSALVTRSGVGSARPPAGCATLQLDALAATLAGESTANLQHATSGESLAYVIYTSGSTGTPKGIGIPHVAVGRLVQDTDYVALGPSDRIAQASTMAFDAATFEIWGALLNGAALVGVPRDTLLSPPELASFLREQKITTLFLTTALFNQVALASPSAFSPLSTLLFGGERVDPARVRDVLQAGGPRRLLHVYGPTETTTFATWHRVDEVTGETVPIGKPIATTTSYVLNDEMRTVPAGVPGELFVGGPGLARGYLNDAAMTAERFVPNPFGEGRLYRTGDHVVERRDGSVEFVGRIDQQIKIRGFRVELGEIQARLLEHRSVAQAVAVFRNDRIIAYIVVASGAANDLADARAHLAERSPST